jgi:hypothetical protein
MGGESPSVLAHQTRLLRAYLTDGEAGLERVASRLHDRAHRQPRGTFGKRETSYLPQSPFLPVMWRYSCERCRFYQEGGPGEPAGCHVVGREGDPYGGKAIHPEGWCGLWMPPAGEPAFAWLRERLRPDGKSSVRGVYDPLRTRKDRRRAETERHGEWVEIPIEQGED